MRILSAPLRSTSASTRSTELYWTPVPRELAAQLAQQIEQLRAVMPQTGPARAVLQAELDRLEGYQAQLMRTGNLVQLPKGADLRSIVRPSPALKAELKKIHDQTLEGLRATLGNPYNWYGGRVPPFVSEALKRAQGPRDLEAMLGRADVQKALRTMTDFGYEPVGEWQQLSAALSVVRQVFSPAV